MHRAALAFGIASDASRQFGHNTFGIHAAGQHMAVIAIRSDALVAFFGGGLKAHNHGFLPDIEMAEPANQTHAIKLARFFFESADQQHIAVIFQQVLR